MAERTNAAVLKTVVLYPRDRGFESLFLRRANYSRSKLRDFYFQLTEPGLHERGKLKIKYGKEKEYYIEQETEKVRKLFMKSD